MKVASKPITDISESARWGQPRYLLMAASSAQFIVLTVIAMVLYPGGQLTDDTTVGYDFFRNFFSDLGRTQGYAGGTQWGSTALFFIALNVGGLGLIYFFIHAPKLFKGQRVERILAIVGSMFGIFAGICFMGVAFTPANVPTLLQPHILFVQLAFTTFLVVVITYAIAIWRTAYYPNMYAWAYVGFGVVLSAYIYLLFWGPPADTDTGLIINATGQKIIVYSSLIIMFIQSLGAWRVDQ